MTLESFYNTIGGDYKKTVERLYNETLLRKFVMKYRSDGTFAQLKEAHDSKNWEEAFRAAHTLNGLALNLGFNQLNKSASALTEHLRGGKPLTDESLYNAVERDHMLVINSIDELDA